MARFIEIYQKYIKNGIYYYEVHDFDIESGGQFYIGIDPAKKIVNYYTLTNLDEPIGHMNFSTSNEFTYIPYFNVGAVKWAAVNAYNALKKNIFPHGMSFQS